MPQPSQKHTEMVHKGLSLHNRRAFREAEYWYQMVLRENPNHPDALHLMGLLAIEANRTGLAIEYMTKALRQLPKQPIYLNNLGNAYLLQGDAASALGPLKKAIRIDSRYVEAINNLGRAYRALAQPDRAMRCFRQALEIQPDFIRTKSAMGEMLVETGDMDAALKVFREILSVAPGNVQALSGIAVAKRAGQDDPELDVIESLLKRSDLISDHRVLLHHAAGKICNDLERYDDAFEHFRAGKLASGARFPIELHRRTYQTIKKRLTRDAMSASSNNNHITGSEAPIFIVGMPRSGTTLVEQILSSHPQVEGAGELPDMRRLGVRLGFGAPDPDLYCNNLLKLDEQNLQVMAAVYLRTLQRGRKAARRCTDKNPQNYEQLALVARLFPNAHVIHCRRDPLDTCISNYMQNFDESHGYNADLDVLGQYYRLYFDLMNHWQSNLNLPVLTIDYEDLVKEQENITRQIISFLGLEWDDACLRYFENQRPVTTPSRWQVRQPIYNSSVRRWTRYRNHIGPLIMSLGDLAKSSVTND